MGSQTGKNPAYVLQAYRYLFARVLKTSAGSHTAARLNPNLPAEMFTCRWIKKKELLKKQKINYFKKQKKYCAGLLAARLKTSLAAGRPAFDNPPKIGAIQPSKIPATFEGKRWPLF